jgi:glyoxylase-like metal-dependent hydrolase (beta-lactamase superfamily II)
VSHVAWLAPGWGWLPLRTPTLPPSTHTNAVMVGQGQFAVIDPGSPWEDQQALLQAELRRRLERGERWLGVWLTHHHPDHLGGVQALAQWRQALGLGELSVWGHPETLARAPQWSGARLHPVGDGQVLHQEVRALWTPGHAPGHLAFWEARRGICYAGDMVATEGTIIINPPEGDMGDYLDSLRRLLDLGAEVMLPSHGQALRGDEVAALLERYREHRLAREAMARAALGQRPRSLEALVPAAYPGLEPSLYPLAARSLEAHLLKLERDNEAVRQGGLWRSPLV